MQGFEDGIRRTVGDAVSEAEIQELLLLAYSDLQVAVGVALSEGLSDERLAEFEGLIDAGDEEGASRWLALNRPDYKEIVEAEFSVLLTRLAAAYA
jgi:hypothetical protein